MIERPISRTQHSSETRSCACLVCLVPSYLFLGKSVLLVELILLYCLRISFWQNLKFSIKRNEPQICSRFGAHIIRGRLFFCLLLLLQEFYSGGSEGAFVLCLHAHPLSVGGVGEDPVSVPQGQEEILHGSVDHDHMVKLSSPFDLDLERYGAFLRIDLDLSLADFDHILVVAVVSVVGAALARLYDLMVFQKEIAIVQEKVQVVRQRKARGGGEGESQVHFRQVVIHVLVVDFQIAFHGVGPECVSFLGRAVGGAGKRDVHVPFGVEKHSVFLFVLDDLAEIRAGVLDVLEIGLFGQIFVADVGILKGHRPPGPGGRPLKDLVKGNEAVVVEIAGTRIGRGVKAESEKREAEIGSVGILVVLAGGQEERVLLEVRDHVAVEPAVFFRLLCHQFRSHAFREQFGLVDAGDHAAGEAGV